MVEIIYIHSDDETWLNPITKYIICITYGCKRIFRVRNKEKKIVYDIEPSGSLLFMDGNFQSEFTHEIQIRKKILQPRVSLTFGYRKI